jgi:hypothetical protein
LLGFLQLPLCALWVDQGRAAKHDDRRANAQLLECEFWFQLLELKANGAQFGLIQEREVSIRAPIGCAVCDLLSRVL